MSKQTKTSFLISSPWFELYQKLLTGIGSYEELGRRIVNQIKLYHSFRQKDKVREMGLILANFPLKEFHLIGQYYLVRCGSGEKKDHPYILEQVIEQSQTYKTRALQSRAAHDVYQGKLTEALSFYMECFKTHLTISEYSETAKAIAYIKSVEGFHESALKDLENLIPLLKYAEPFAYYDILNSLAVELGEAGRKEEARNVSRIVLASPFINAYPEWQETARDLKGPARSFAALNRSPSSPRNVLPMPLAEQGNSGRNRYKRPARVLSLEQWKEEMGKELPGRMRKRKSLQDMNEKEIFMRAMKLFADAKIPQSTRLRMLEATERIAFEPDEPGDQGA